MTKSINRALVLSGGGQFGSFQVGALRYLLEENREWYRSFCGVSVGAINAAHLAHYNKNYPAIIQLERLWKELNDKQVKKHWFPFSFLHAPWKMGFYDTSPLRKIIDTYLNQTILRHSGNQLRIGTVNIRTRKYEVFNQNSLVLKEAVMASSAFPLVFPPQKLYGDLWTDGGVRNQTPLSEAFDIPEVEEIDIILASSPAKPAGQNPKNLLSFAEGVIIPMADEIMETDLKLALAYNELAKRGLYSKKRYVPIRFIKPPEDRKLVGEALVFDPASIRENMEIGYYAAKEQLGSQVSLHQTNV